MQYCDINKKYSQPIALALGFFDCIHLGHVDVIDTVVQMAKNGVNGAKKSAVFTFNNDFSELFATKKQIYNFEDRASVLSKMHLDILFSTKFDLPFSMLSPTDFLNLLKNNLNVRAIAVGSDYRFGRDAMGNVELLAEFCKNNDIELNVVPFQMMGDLKISTSILKTYLLTGNVKALNAYLSEPYFVEGSVIHERHVGSQIGFPTANITLSNDKLHICDGIYATKVLVDGSWYHAMTNVGAKPTFDVSSKSIETYIFDFDQDIYGKNIKVVFVDRIRDIIKFESLDALISQLNKDKETAKSILKQVE